MCNCKILVYPVCLPRNPLKYVSSNESTSWLFIANSVFSTCLNTRKCSLCWRTYSAITIVDPVAFVGIVSGLNRRTKAPPISCKYVAGDIDSLGGERWVVVLKTEEEELRRPRTWRVIKWGGTGDHFGVGVSSSGQTLSSSLSSLLR